MIGLVYCAQAGQERLYKMEVSRHKPWISTCKALQCLSPLKLKLKNKNICKKCPIYILTSRLSHTNLFVVETVNWYEIHKRWKSTRLDVLVSDINLHCETSFLLDTRHV